LSVHEKFLRYTRLDAEVQGHIHAGLRSAPTSKRYQRWYTAHLIELQDARDAAKAEWDAVKPPPPTRREKLISAANGHPDNEATHAARNICRKHGIDFSCTTEGTTS
jgi:hypothetical protein